MLGAPHQGLQVVTLPLHAERSKLRDGTTAVGLPPSCSSPSAPRERLNSTQLLPLHPSNPPAPEREVSRTARFAGAESGSETTSQEQSMCLSPWLFDLYLVNAQLLEVMSQTKELPGSSRRRLSAHLCCQRGAGRRELP